MADGDLIAALEEAVSLQPDNVDLRAHLAALLVSAGRGKEGLEHALKALAHRPDHVAALRAAGLACRAQGEAERAAGYERMLAALDGGADGAARVDADGEVGSIERSVDEGEDELDRFLRNVLEDDARSRVRLSDVGGMQDAKRRLELSFFGPMRNPALRQAFGSTLRGGLLLYGPPGCGKTFLARAIAGEMGARFVHVGLHDVLDMWLGNSEKRLHEIFEYARRHHPTVVFFDEVDALGLKRSALASSAGRGVAAQLLEELDGVTGDNDGLFILGATNAPWDVDPALRRPGRFDRTMFVAPPDKDARLSILQYHLRDRPTALDDLAQVAAKTEGFSGADLRLLCEGAAELALEESMKGGRVVPIEASHIKRALKQTRPSIGSWVETARNVAAFANQSGDYDELAQYLQSRR